MSDLYDVPPPRSPESGAERDASTRRAGKYLFGLIVTAIGVALPPWPALIWLGLLALAFVAEMFRVWRMVRADLEAARATH